MRSSTDSSCASSAPTSLLRSPRPPVDRLQDHRDAVPLGRRARQRLQRRDRLRLSGRPLQHLGVTIDRRGDVVQLARAGSAARRSLTASPSRAFGEAVERRRQVIGQLVPLLLGAQQPLQLARRSPRSAGSTSIASRSVPIARPRLSSFSSSSFALRRSSASFARRVDGAPGLLVNQLAQLLPGPPALQRPLEQLRRRRDRRGARRTAGGSTSPPPADDPALVEDLRGPAHDVEHRRAPRPARPRDSSASRLARSCQRSELVGQANQLLQAEALGRRLLEDLAVPAQGAVVVLQLLLEEARDPLRSRPAAAPGSSTCSRRISPILISDGQSARPA